MNLREVMIVFMCLQVGNSLKNNSFSEDSSAIHIDHLATETYTVLQ